MNYKEKKRLRLLKSLVAKWNNGTFNIPYLFDLPYPFGFEKVYDLSHLNETKNLIKELDISYDDFMIIFYELKSNKWDRRAVLNNKPTKVHKDNSIWSTKTLKIGPTSSKIRYPRKKRKTAWKRFYKIFPRLKPI